ncbi:uncharacterized protein LOC141660154 [Apium graveolens]|uniref:uncharacterized protein LOC141660154 n=1 Tax=Apium graveolens TaxID=4045 RepID=UPI003D7A91B3
MAKWSIHLSMYEITYESRTAIKSQALADFVADFSPNLLCQADQELQHLISIVKVQPWSLYTDGASNINGTGLGLVLKLPHGDTLVYSICCEFKATNNEYEYEALIIGMTTTLDLNIVHLEVKCDSLLIVNHVKGTYEAKDNKMMKYLEIVKRLQSKFDSFTKQQVPREENIQADALEGNGAVSRQMNISNIPIIHILKPTMEMNEEKYSVMDIEEGECYGWMIKYNEFFSKDISFNNKNEATTFKMKASRFCLIDGILFKKSVSGLLQICLEKEEYEQVLRDIHERDCGNHTGGRNLLCKILRMGYYWHMVKQDVIDYV